MSGLNNGRVVTDLGVNNLTVQQNIVSRGNLVANEAYFTNVHVHDIECDTAIVHNLVTVDDASTVTGGIQSTGNFILKATTDLSEWTFGPGLEAQISPAVLIGNRVGQLCYLYISLTNNSGGSIVLTSPIFTSIPHAFNPGTQTMCFIPMSITPSIPYDILVPFALVFNASDQCVYINGNAGSWNNGDTIVGSISYFRTLDD